MDNDFKAARRASGLSITDAASACGISSVTYATAREGEPGMFRLDELKNLQGAMSKTSRKLLLEAISNYLRL